MYDGFQSFIKILIWSCLTPSTDEKIKLVACYGAVERLKAEGEEGHRGWCGRFNGHELGQTPGDGEGQGNLACCSLWGHEESDTTCWLNNNNKWDICSKYAAIFKRFCPGEQYLPFSSTADDPFTVAGGGDGGHANPVGIVNNVHQSACLRGEGSDSTIVPCWHEREREGRQDEHTLNPKWDTGCEGTVVVMEGRGPSPTHCQESQPPFPWFPKLVTPPKGNEQLASAKPASRCTPPQETEVGRPTPTSPMNCKLAHSTRWLMLQLGCQPEIRSQLPEEFCLKACQPWGLPWPSSG